MTTIDSRVVAVITSHNRRESTLRCLQHLCNQDGNLKVSVALHDDGSSDGTAASVTNRFPDAVVLHGDGDAYWGGGTYRAFQAASEQPTDYFLVLNDDTFLDQDALVRLVGLHRELEQRGCNCLIAGATRDPESGAATYGGLVRTKRFIRPMYFTPAGLRTRSRIVDAANGNCLLLDAKIVATIGFNDPELPHAMGDLDLTLRSNAAGFPVVVAPGSIGTCARNMTPAPQIQLGLAARISEAWRQITSVKSHPPRAYLRFMRRWGGPLWPVFFLTPYARAILRAALRKQ